MDSSKDIKIITIYKLKLWFLYLLSCVNYKKIKTKVVVLKGMTDLSAFLKKEIYNSQISEV